MPPAAPTQSVYLHAGDGPIDTTVWPPSGFQTPPSSVEGQPVPSEPLYYFAGDTADPATTNGASVPDWGLYTGPTEAVPAQTEPTGQPSAEAQAADPQPAQTTTAPTGGAQAAPSAPTSEQPAATEQTTTASGSSQQTAADSSSTSPQDGSTPSSAPPASTGSASDASGQPPAASTTGSSPSAGTEPSADAQGAPETPEVGADGAAAQQPAEPAATVPASSAPTVPPIPGVVSGVVYRPRTDDDVLSGNFCRVVSGEHQGRYGVFVGTSTVFVNDGWPATVTVRTRDDRDELILVNYADIRPAQPGGR